MRLRKLTLREFSCARRLKTTLSLFLKNRRSRCSHDKKGFSFVPLSSKASSFFLSFSPRVFLPDSFFMHRRRPTPFMRQVCPLWILAKKLTFGTFPFFVAFKHPAHSWNSRTRRLIVLWCLESGTCCSRDSFTSYTYLHYLTFWRY